MVDRTLGPIKRACLSMHNDEPECEVQHDDSGRVETSSDDTSEFVSSEGTSVEGSSQIFQIGDWVVVNYDGMEYPGTITSTTTLEDGRQEFQVRAMKRFGVYWRWPREDDLITYPCERVLRIIDSPIFVGSRGQHKFRDI